MSKAHFTWWVAVTALMLGIVFPGKPELVAHAAQATLAPKVWVGRLVSNTLGYTKGGGAIFRVYVTGVSGTRIELSYDDELMFAESGSKPEYGPYAAEFAPVRAGLWTIHVPALGVSTQVASDDYNFAVIEFLQVPAAEATQTVVVPPTATPLGGQLWAGRVATEKFGIGANYSRLLVQVIGRGGQPVRLSTLDRVINTANTGQKPNELGLDVVEFTALTPAKYIIEPVGLNARFEVELKNNTETRVEFSPQTPPPPPTNTPLPPPPTYTSAPPTATLTPSITPTPTATSTPTVAPTATVTPLPTATKTPLPTPTSATRWLGVIAERRASSTEGSAIEIKVVGVSGLPIRLQASRTNINAERRCITGQAAGQVDICRFTELSPGAYRIAPEGLGLSLPVTLFEKEQVQVIFDKEALAAGFLGWQARLLKNENYPQATSQTNSTITALLTGKTGQVVALRSVRGTEQFCEVRPNPILGNLACEFGNLAPGVYLVEALHTGTGIRLFADGTGLAEVIFEPNATYTTLALAQSPPIVGQGALPRRPTPTITPTPTAAVLRPTFTLTPIPTATRAPTPTPAYGWQGRIIQTQDGVVGTIAVRAAGLKDHPVVLRSGPWQSQPQLTGTKPELGEYSAEFGGLATGKYTVELLGLAQLEVNLGPGQFMLIEFRYDLVKPGRK